MKCTGHKLYLHIPYTISYHFQLSSSIMLKLRISFILATCMESLQLFVAFSGPKERHVDRNTLKPDPLPFG